MGLSSLFVLPVLLAVLVYLLRGLKRPNLPLPPGPRKLPLIGNLLDVPSQDPWIAFSRMAKEASAYIFYDKVWAV